jgi:hypothetical protein
MLLCRYRISASHASQSFVAIVLIGNVPFAVALGRFRRTLGSMA